MAFMNLLVFLSSYSDPKGSNSPALSNFKWSREIDGLQVSNPSSQVLTIPANGSATVFTGAQKKFLYVESDLQANLTVNGSAISIKPYVINTSTKPGHFLMGGDVNSLVIANPSTTDSITVFIASAE
jgi:hypothetical protein